MGFNFIILLLIFRKLCFYPYPEYHQYRDGVEETFRVTKTSAEYRFCIWANNAKSVIFNAKTTNGCKLTTIYVYEYLDRRDRGRYNIISDKVEKKNDICEYYYIHTISYFNIHFVDFSTTITDYSNNKTNITIRMDLIHGEYDLYNGNPWKDLIYIQVIHIFYI